LESIVDEIYALLREAITTGYSVHWADFGSWLDIGQSLAMALTARKAAAASIGGGYGPDIGSASGGLSISGHEGAPYVASIGNLEGTDPVGENWIREMYVRNWDALVEWDDVEYIRD
jgi:hypothetical protein